MTRFQIVGIFEDKILTAGEFNGDGYFEGMGKEVCREFAKITTEEEYQKLAKDINDNHYEYEGQIVFELSQTIQSAKDHSEVNIFDFYQLDKKHEYFNTWFSDYLYIKNFTEDDKVIIDENGIIITIHPQGWVTINFGRLYTKEDYNIPEDSQYDVEIDVGERVRKICEECDWCVSEEYGNMLYISRYTPAGEDFGFDVDARDVVNEIKRYADNFDVDEHVKMWITSDRWTPSVRTLLKDAEWIDEKLQELAKAFEEKGGNNELLF